MKSSNITCRCCGKCCLASFIAYVTEDDLIRWRCEARQDIMKVIEHGHVIWAGDHMMSADDGHYAHDCPFLIAVDNKWLCSIYETRPLVCRNYAPGSSEICPLWRNNNHESK